MSLQACLGATKKQLGADKFGDVVKTGSSTALAAVTLWNQVPSVILPAVMRGFFLVMMLLSAGMHARLSADGVLRPQLEEEREGGSAL